MEGGWQCGMQGLARGRPGAPAASCNTWHGLSCITPAATAHVALLHQRRVAHAASQQHRAPQATAHVALLHQRRVAQLLGPHVVHVRDGQAVLRRVKVRGDGQAGVVASACAGADQVVDVLRRPLPATARSNWPSIQRFPLTSVLEMNSMSSRSTSLTTMILALAWRAGGGGGDSAVSEARTYVQQPR